MTGPTPPPVPYGPVPYHPGTPPDRPRGATWVRRLQARTTRRPEPRLGLSLAGVGIVLAILGVVVWSGTYLGQATGVSVGGGGGDTSRRYLGIILSLAVVFAGYVLAIAARRGPLATAGVVSSALGVPVFLGFATFDPGSGGPFSIDAVVWVSIVVWVVSYLVVRGTRGHAFYLGLTALTFWIYLLDKVEPRVLSLPSTVTGAVLSPLGGTTDVSPALPDFTTLGGASITIGVGYYLVALWMDAARRPGPAVPFALAGFPAVAVGIAALAPDIHQIGAGVLLIVIGLLVGAYGGHYGRRFTTWVWAAGVALGAVLIITKIVQSGVIGGITLIVVGALFVVLGVVVSIVLREPPDEVAPPTVPARGF